MFQHETKSQPTETKHRRKLSRLKLIIPSQRRECKQINFRLKQFKNASKGNGKLKKIVDHFWHEEYSFWRIIKSNQRRKSNQYKQKEGPEFFLNFGKMLQLQQNSYSLNIGIGVTSKEEASRKKCIQVSLFAPLIVRSGKPMK